ncbi:MAG: AAA family ATPase [Ruminococcus sp.]|nr:AAA family ATPase [Ruminococcus sp.]
MKAVIKEGDYMDYHFMKGKFTEAELEKAIIELCTQQGYTYVCGENIHRKYEDILLLDDLRSYLTLRYSKDGLSDTEMQKIINKLSLINATPLYIGNREAFRLVNEGFDLARDDFSKVALHIDYINYDEPDKNIFKVVNQYSVQGEHLRRPDMLLFSPEEIESDESTIDALQNNLDGINKQIGELNYISKSLESVNTELGEISVHNMDQAVCFVAGESNVDRLLDNLVLAYSNGNNPLSIGGDGRNNQIFLATWISKQHIQESVDHITFYAIEEPEAHLHPHQQRKLASYIMDKFDSQVFITTHSPHIASKFNPDCIVRLYSENKLSFAACSGCSPKIKTVIDEFSYRLNSLSAETFFSDGVFLVEGPSEVILYSAIAAELGLDLDRRNISILSVEGIGFKPYVAVCDALNIPWVLRTDNDIFKIPRSKPAKLHYAGISRAIGIAEICCESTDNLLKYWKEHESENEWLIDDTNPESVPTVAKTLNEYIRNQAKQHGLFLSDIDLENDLANSAISGDLKEYYDIFDINNLVKAMQNRKAENMLDFLSEKHSKLSLLKEDRICDPLNALILKVEEKTRSKQ